MTTKLFLSWALGNIYPMVVNALAPGNKEKLPPGTTSDLCFSSWS